MIQFVLKIVYMSLAVYGQKNLWT